MLTESKTTSRDESTLIQSIYDSAEKKEDGKTFAYLFLYGNKELRLSFVPSIGHFITHISTSENTKLKKIPDQTSLLYKAARQAMNKVALQLGKSIPYSLTTENPEMIRWAATIGNTIFSWENPPTINETELYFDEEIKQKVFPQKIFKTTITSKPDEI
ncbi:MAG: hypothetical protein EXS55_04200 [Candidatus Magasanikbacteria bacterium]|nr:hypothetical protein [Candidatus Magasanikbacteria bacterium]